MLAESAADPGAAQHNSGVGVSVPVAVPVGEKSGGVLWDVERHCSKQFPVALIGASFMIGGEV